MSGPPVPRAASGTAIGAAVCRAYHQRFDGEPKILHDPVVLKLVEADLNDPLWIARRKMQGSEFTDTRARVVLRSRFAEERLEAALARGVRQLVILGAGLDTFAYRQPDWARPLRIFEVDHAASQADKRSRLQEAGIAHPANLDYVTIDFERVSLRDGLRASALDFSRPAFFICLGVLVYLTQEAVDAIFELVASFPAGSEIAFTFAPTSSLQGEVARRFAAIGEPRLSHAEPDELAQRLRAIGFGDVRFLQRDEAQARYFAGRNDNFEAPPWSGIAAAIVGT